MWTSEASLKLTDSTASRKPCINCPVQPHTHTHTHTNRGSISLSLSTLPLRRGLGRWDRNRCRNDVINVAIGGQRSVGDAC